MRGTTGGKSGGAAGIRGIAVAGASNGPAIAPSNQESRADQRDHDARTVRSMSQDADTLSGCKKSKRAELMAQGFLIHPMGLGGRARAFFDYELVETRDAFLANLSEDEKRAIVSRHAALREARFNALRERVANPAAR